MKKNQQKYFKEGIWLHKLEFLTASKYWGSGLKNDLVVVVVILVLVIKLLSNLTAFVRFNEINMFCKIVSIFSSL